MKLTFMGTAGARFMVAKQLAASGGLFLEEGNTRISLDPGPGAIVQYAKRKVDLTGIWGSCPELGPLLPYVLTLAVLFAFGGGRRPPLALGQAVDK